MQHLASPTLPALDRGNGLSTWRARRILSSITIANVLLRYTHPPRSYRYWAPLLTLKPIRKMLQRLLWKERSVCSRGKKIQPLRPVSNCAQHQAAYGCGSGRQISPQPLDGKAGSSYSKGKEWKTYFQSSH